MEICNAQHTARHTEEAAQAYKPNRPNL